MLTALDGKPKIHWTRLNPDTEEALFDMQAQIPEAVLSPTLGQDGM
jgi:hypothetical protein